MNPYNSIKFHRALINDRARSDAYRDAIHRTVRPGDVVLDIGTGSGLMAFFACEAGASRVYAVDSSDIITLAGRLAKENGLQDRIQFIKGDIRSIAVAEKVDVITSELITDVVIGERMEELLAICRERFLKPGGHIIPKQVELNVAPIESNDDYQKLDFVSPDVYGLEFKSAREVAFNETYSIRLQPEFLLAAPQQAYRMNSTDCAPLDHPQAELTFSITRPGILHGFGAWFSSELAEGSFLSNYPSSTSSWSNRLFPLLSPVEVKPGYLVRLRLSGFHPPGTSLVWQWTTEVLQSDARTHNLSSVAEFKQSTFAHSIHSLESVLEASSGFRPTLSSAGRRVASLVKRLDANLSVGELTTQLVAEYPEVWQGEREAKEFVQLILLGFHRNGYVE